MIFIKRQPDGEYLCDLAYNYTKNAIPNLELVDVYSSNRDTGGLVPDREDIYTTISQGAGFVDFEGHYHPTLGKKTLACTSCLLKVEESVTNWRNFTLSNSFNPESSTSTLNLDKTSLLKEFIEVKKQFTNDLLIYFNINNERREY